MQRFFVYSVSANDPVLLKIFKSNVKPRKDLKLVKSNVKVDLSCKLYRNKKTAMSLKVSSQVFVPKIYSNQFDLLVSGWSDTKAMQSSFG